MRTTVKKVNLALQKAGFRGVEVVKGQGYWYFAGGVTEKWTETSVFTLYLTSMTVEGWVDTAKWMNTHCHR